MSLLIKGMEMPESCRDCCFCGGQVDTGYGVCARCEVDGKDRDAYTRLDCPLVPVPPHGRCIVADELFKEMERKGWFDNADRGKAEDLVLAAPTIIPAEKGD